MIAHVIHKAKMVKEARTEWYYVVVSVSNEGDCTVGTAYAN
jgi:hypothetical protein